ncbi:MAG TPA: phosphoadenylyl-sulfate reductase [Alteromonas australica]|mgnify:CR=1 FL=1|jgi:phosphoadenosine phosphosulfate reductase|uniref:Phosphoadenosine 5'-phosphosulfate reductase n=1 Tax=Alteromonas australica TaxID=589873 RepID=A0A353JLB4_9ALTE|nr:MULTISPECIES: phosphoadenylyl-sulfate reductase [Alteromonas]MAB93269.1 phosphoadenylyl-sulfate reductase [Alteromonas sp.]AJP45012.1 phosphoadenosine phosphosulfate reductase [Alteromonas australica]MAF70913.1 phosphoadenylyl-sulfate reductase [Alteromonas sp.]MAO31605.1 phosphoadenylyl-sulfate reductase [Alteromonas sp.]MBU34115.1 phosphoadenylyl-sulfate reductase [Alteromonas sp.]|tara:strand:+ start:3225 stop:3971 length:747 start_codon:yes stop_codon:yes gene_type:complete
MTNSTLSDITPLTLDISKEALADINEALEAMDAQARVAWALENLPANHIVSSSFGAQSAVMLHMLTQAQPNIPVVLTDTGYLFPETYGFIDELTEKLDLNLHVYRAKLSAAWQEARFGRLWEKGIEGIEKYNQMNKVEPMQRALGELKAGTWFAGLRRSQSDTRGKLPVLQKVGNQFKLYPIIDWSNKDLHYYLKEHNLPYHPLWEQGYVSIGDWHTTQSLQEGMNEQDTRFFGLKRECGLHEFGDGI